jgi:hypothetical protein
MVESARRTMSLTNKVLLSQYFWTYARGDNWLLAHRRWRSEQATLVRRSTFDTTPRFIACGNKEVES